MALGALLAPLPLPLPPLPLLPLLPLLLLLRMLQLPALLCQEVHKTGLLTLRSCVWRLVELQGLFIISHRDALHP